jgi:hypothetical protein
MVKRSQVALLLVALLLSACSAAKSVGTQSPNIGGAPSESTGNRATAPQAPAALPQAQDSFNSDKATGSSGNSQAVDRLVIRNATLIIVVTDPFKSMDAITQMATNMNGFVVSSNAYKVNLQDGGEAPEASITVRVPAAQLNAALLQIKQQVKDPNKDVLTENVTGQDVTKEYTDLKSRETNLEQAEAQLREIMASATKPEDVLNVFNQLTSVREQIEVLKGQIQYYQESAAMSAISVTIRATETVKPLTIGSWQPAGVARDALQATVSAAKTLANVAIWLVLFALPIGVVVFLFFRLLWTLFKRLRKPKTPSPMAPPAAMPPAV